ncbi:hypothetical protein ACJ41O_013276 [Fusarium nematophilum]
MRRFAFLSFLLPITATPLPQSGADSCAVETLNAETWDTLNIYQFLKNWAANATEAKTGSIQAMSQPFGAPNFFCYMNSVNTAISFASSIMSLYLPGMVSGLCPKPRDDITPLKDFYKMFNAVLGLTNKDKDCIGKDKRIGISSLRVMNDDGTWRMLTLVDNDFYPQNGMMGTLIDKYGLTQQMVP